MEIRVGRDTQETGIFVYIWLIHDVVQQKLMQYYKSSIFQLFEKGEKKKKPSHTVILCLHVAVPLTISPTAGYYLCDFM